MLAMIPVDALAAGRHGLTLLPMLRETHYEAPDAGTVDSKDPPEPYLIPFWR